MKNGNKLIHFFSLFFFFFFPVAERPQHMLMRVSVGIHGEDLPAVIEVIAVW